MRAYVGAACVAWLVFGFGAAFAGPAAVNPADLERLYNALHAPNATENPRQYQTDEGFLRFVAAPPGSYFTTGVSGAKSAAPELSAQAFVATNVGAFARPSARMAFNTDRVKVSGDQSFVRLQQTYNGIEVFAGQLTVQTDASGGVVCVLSDVLRNTTTLDDGTLSLTPRFGVTESQAQALGWARNTYGGTDSEYTINEGTRMVFDPDVVGDAGDIVLVWKFVLFRASDPPVKEVVFVNAQSGGIVFHYPLIHDARVRKIYDGNNTYTYNTAGPPYIISDGTLVRGEGDDPCNIQDADLAYDYFGDTYDFYSRVHGRDSIDGKGMTISGTVRWCHPFESCPYENAFWSSEDSAEPAYGINANRMYFGDGFAAADDVIAHELTHGVTNLESNLIYANESGALNESFSDMWGEWIDLANGRGTDTPAVRWLIGEDLPASFGVIRNMKNPPAFRDPDRMGSPYYYKGTSDNGGVHTNSGVGNKLCYLLTDGDSFNGYTITGLGIEKAAKLFYELNTNLLTEASDFTDVYYALGQATINLGFTPLERTNVRQAAIAVEIAPDTSEELIKGFRAIPTIDKIGRSVISLTWTNPTSKQFKRVIIARSTETYPKISTDGEEIYRGSDEKFLDIAVTAGTQYYYTIFSQLTAGFPDQRFTRAIAGTAPADFLTESFTATSTASSTANPFDLSFTQLLFSPVGAPEVPVGESSTSGNYYSVYNVQVTKNISSLPVPRQDDRGGAYALTLSQNQVWSPATMPAPFPFFGVRYDKIYLAANGYIAFQDVDETSTDNLVASLATHFEIPRLSFLFTNLAPNVFGDAWARLLDDRIVITFENIPEMDSQFNPPAQNPNTVQVELFYSGHIRLTYLSCTAKNAIVGLSDGQGMPVDPALIFPGSQHVKVSSNLSSFPESVTALTLEPLAMQQVDAGAEMVFVAKTRIPAGAGVPTLTAEWNGEGFDAPYSSTTPATQAPFADNGDGTGTFRWKTTLLDYGTYLVRITAKLGSATAYQDVNLAVGVTEPLPSASDVELATNNPLEDPRRDRTVDDDAQLIAQYNYSHAGEFLLPALFAEGPTQILWFKNSLLIPAFNNVRVVPPDATKPNETWWYVVTPKTISSSSGSPLSGKPQMSPKVTIVGLPRIFNVVLPENVPADAADGVQLSNLPAASGPTAGGTTVVILGKRLSNPIAVTFGGIQAQSIHAVSAYRLEVVTPAHAASGIAAGSPIPEDVTVITAAGPTTLQEAFTYTGNSGSLAKADVNKDGKVDAADVQLVVNAILQVAAKSQVDADVNLDGKVNAADLQVVISVAVGN